MPNTYLRSRVKSFNDKLPETVSDRAPLVYQRRGNEDWPLRVNLLAGGVHEIRYSAGVGAGARAATSGEFRLLKLAR